MAQMTPLGESPREFELKQKLALAQALQQQSMDSSPIQSPWQGLARMGQAALGGYQQYKAQQDYGRKQGQSQQALAQALSTMQGVPAWQNPDAPAGSGPAIPAVAPDKIKAYQMLLNSDDPQLAQMALNMQLNDASQQGENQQWQQRFEQGNQADMQKMKAQQEFQAQQNQMQLGAARDLAEMKAKADGGNRFYAVPTSQGWVKMDKSTGDVALISPQEASTLPQAAPVAGGAPTSSAQAPAQPFLPPSADAAMQGNVAAAKASGTAQGGVQGQAVADLPAATQGGEMVSGLINSVKTDPQLDNALGVISGRLPAITGYNSGVVAKIDQLKGNAFLQAFQSLKGGGQITEVEGAKATDAQARLNRAQTKEEFVSALNDMQQLIKDHLAVQQQKANSSIVLPNQGAPANGGWSIQRVQ